MYKMLETTLLATLRVIVNYVDDPPFPLFPFDVYIDEAVIYKKKSLFLEDEMNIKWSSYARSMCVVVRVARCPDVCNFRK